tara:strand:- start:2176 stop:2640 length:465 start_codon:yes stop_codon:yes gene_type:complete
MIPKKQAFLGALLKSPVGDALGDLASAGVNRLLYGKGANKEMREAELDALRGGDEAGEEGEGEITIRITKGGDIIQEAKRGARVKRKKKSKGKGYASLSPAQKQVYKRGLAAYMSSGNRPKVSQHAWAMARVRSAFGRREAAKIRAGKGKKKKK